MDSRMLICADVLPRRAAVRKHLESLPLGCLETLRREYLLAALGGRQAPHDQAVLAEMDGVIARKLVEEVEASEHAA